MLLTSCFNMKTPQGTEGQAYTCGNCAMFYYEYYHLVEHLYWKHGTESQFCNKCGLKKWRFAIHICNVLPDTGFTDSFDNGDGDEPVKCADDVQCPTKTEEVYCFCGKDVDDSMIGCDGPKCPKQWYHFTCVGIVVPPEGDWICPECTRNSQNGANGEKT